MRVLVVAGTGFVGGHAARAFLDRGDEVTVVVRDERRARADERLRGARVLVGAAGALPACEPQDVVVYAAGAWKLDDDAPEEEIARRCREVYVDGVQEVAERGARWGAHVMFLSGTSRFGDREGLLEEDTAPGTLSIYGAHKRRSEAIFAGTRGLRWTALVPPEIYGTHNDGGGWVRFVFDRVRARRFVLLGDGDNRWSLCNVHNLTDAMLRLSADDGRGVLLVADARPTSQRELATAIARVLGRRPLFPRVPRTIALAAAALAARVPRRGPRFTPLVVRVRTRETLLDTSKAARAGLVAAHGLDAGIAEAVAWWRSPRRARV